MDHWRELSEQALAHTPADRPLEPRFEIPEASLILDPEPEAAPETPFPQQRVSLRMQEAPMATLLMALARAAQVNMVLSPNVRAMQGVSVIIDNVPWETAFLNLTEAHGLVHSWSSGVLQVRTLDDVRQDMERERVAQDFTKLRAEAMSSGPLVTSVIKLRYLNLGQDPATGTGGRTGTSGTSGSDLTGMITKLLGGSGGEGAQGVVVPHPETNSLVLQAPRNITNNVFVLLEHLDRPRPQILIQAHIVETTKETARDLGIQWGGRRAGFAGDQPWMVAPGARMPASGTQTGQSQAGEWPTGDFSRPFFDAGQGSGGMAGNFPADLTTTLTGLTLGVIVGSPNYLEVQLSALQRDGKLNILSSPSITTMNNLMAFTENGERVPYITRDDDGNRSVAFEDAVLRLEITPHVVDAEHLRMDINIKKDEVDLVRNVDGNPYIIKKETQTTLVVGNTETVVISGLTKELTSRRLDGVPWLKDLPGLGALFRRDASRLDMEEVLIFITPTIIPERTVPLSQNTAPRPLTQ